MTQGKPRVRATSGALFKCGDRTNSGTTTRACRQAGEAALTAGGLTTYLTTYPASIDEEWRRTAKSNKRRSPSSCSALPYFTAF